MTLRCGRFVLPRRRALLMGVVNVTPDSFSDGGRFHDAGAAVAQARKLVDDGADLLDIGGESTRPGAEPVSVDEELARVIPVLEALLDVGVPVSIDTRKPEVMRAALAAGASMINDIEALQAPGAIEAVAASDCAVCLMHKKGDPATMQQAPWYEDVVSEVRDFLVERARTAEAGGVARERLVLDPGFGFGKNDAHNLRLLKELPALVAAGYPVLAGWSRKSTLGRLTGRPAGERLAASLAAALLAAQGGATILRVHDVRESRDALRILEAFESS